MMKSGKFLVIGITIFLIMLFPKTSRAMEYNKENYQTLLAKITDVDTSSEIVVENIDKDNSLRSLERKLNKTRSDNELLLAENESLKEQIREKKEEEERLRLEEEQKRKESERQRLQVEGINSKLSFNGDRVLLGTFNASAYTDNASSQGNWVGKTATGTRPKRGTVAVDPSVIPLGTRLYVESVDGTSDYGYAVAEDTGGAIKGKKIDLFLNSKNECFNFGRRNVKVYIVK